MNLTITPDNGTLTLDVSENGDGLPLDVTVTPVPPVGIMLNMGLPGAPGAPGEPGDTAAVDAAAVALAEAAAALAAALPGLASTAQFEAFELAVAALINDIPECDLSSLATFTQLVDTVGAAVTALQAAIAEIPATDLTGTATAGNVETARQDLADRLASLDIAASLLAYNVAKVSDITALADQVTTLRTDVLQAIDDIEIPAPDLGPVVKTADLPALVTAINDHTTSQIATIPAVSGFATPAQVASVGPRIGQVATFRADMVPVDYAKIDGTDYIPSGGVLIVTAAGASNAGGAVFVAAGPNPGVWRLRLNLLQRVDLETNAEVGPSYTVPLMYSVNTAHVGMAVVGTKIYLAGVQGGAGVGSALHLVFDTETLATTQLISFPSVIGNSNIRTRCIALDDGRILTATHTVAGAVQLPATTQFFLYDPATPETAPVSVSVSLPITKFAASTGHNLLCGKLPSGLVQLIDGSAPTSGNLLSCNLTVVGNTITPSAAEDTGVSIQHTGLIPTATGALLFQSTSWRSYVQGSGWLAGAQPWAFGSVLSNQQACMAMDGGILMTGGTGTTSLNVYAYFTAAPSAGSTFVNAMRVS